MCYVLQFMLLWWLPLSVYLFVGPKIIIDLSLHQIEIKKMHGKSWFVLNELLSSSLFHGSVMYWECKKNTEKLSLILQIKDSAC